MNTNKIKKTSLSPYELLTEKYSTHEKCLEAIFMARAIKETGGCIRCQADILTHYKKISGRSKYQCNKCKKQVAVMSNTVFERTHLNLRIVFRIAIDKIFHNSGFSGNKICQQYKLSQQTGVRILRVVRELMGLSQSKDLFKGEVEIDEVAIPTGTKGLGRHIKKKRGFGSDAITPFLGLLERGTLRCRMFMLTDRDEETLLSTIMENVELGTTIYTDEWRGYSNLKSLGYNHFVVNHSKHEYSKGNITTNRIEGFFGHIKPNIKGTYRQITEPYSSLYAHEHCFRYTNCGLSVEEKFDKLLNSLPPLFERDRQLLSNEEAA